MFYLPIKTEGYNFDLRLIPFIFLSIFKGLFLIRYTLLITVAFIYYAFIKAEHNKEYYKKQLEL